MVENRLQEIGLKINTSKSSAIVTENGTLMNKTFVSMSNQPINSISKDGKIKYLGVSFSDSLLFDEEKILKKFGTSVEILTKSLLLNSDQKLTILNQYISPILIYPFQSAPLKKLSKTFLESVDKIIRSSVKEILSLPGDTPNSFLYSPKSVKGLEIFNSSWEAFIHQHNKFSLLERSKCNYISKNFSDLKVICLKKLNFNDEEIKLAFDLNKNLNRFIRSTLRNKEYLNWCGLSQKGKGVILYQQVKSANSWIYRRSGLSNSEWIDCIKMTCNVSAVRAIPGRSTHTSHCRRCNEFESLAHVLGYCSYGELARIKRHNDVRSLIANTLRDSGFEVHEEIVGLSTTHSIRRIDIIAINRNINTGYIIDPTIRFEKSLNQPEEVHNEKVSIYESTIEFYKDKFSVKSISIFGLLFGSRGTLTKNYIEFRKFFKLPKSLDYEIILLILKSSVYILRNHLFGVKVN